MKSYRKPSTKGCHFWHIVFKTENTEGSRIVYNKQGSVNYRQFEKENRPKCALSFIITNVTPLDAKTYHSMVLGFRHKANDIGEVGKQ